MTEFITICSAGIITAFAAVVLKKYSPEISVLTAIAGGIIIIISVLPKLTPFISELNEIGELAGIDLSYITILVKAIGICIAGKFSSEFCRDNGFSSLASKVEFASKITVIIIALPLYSKIVSIAAELLKVT